MSQGGPIRSPTGLAAAGLIPPARAHALAPAAARYPMALTPHLAALIDPTDPDDPIARQFIPDPAELAPAPGELLDPIGDEAHRAAPLVVRRYADRVLLAVTQVCPVYCRFCFRRETVGPGKSAPARPDALEAALAYIAATPEIWEVILTGGDPFMLSAKQAAEVTARLAAIDHVQVLRWHTRMPAADPERITPGFAAALKASGKAVYVAAHINHPRELTPQARAAIARLVDAGIVVVSQTVLLKGVNDSAAVLADLMRALTACRVKPYYLHHADLAPGTAHFRTSIEEGQALVRALKLMASGLAQPTYVLDIPGGEGKAPLTPAHVRTGESGLEVLTDAGAWRPYPAITEG